MKVNIFRAADAFLYLPTYLAEHTGIFSTIHPGLEVEFSTPGGRGASDFNALAAMLQADAAATPLPIALCDPLAMFDLPQKLEALFPQLRLVGALITRPPFWAVDGLLQEIEDERELGKRFNKIIYYNETLVTGNFIGRRLSREAGIKERAPVYFGEELQ